MVDKLKNILQQIIKERGAVTLFGVLKMDDLTDKWSIIFSAPWVNESTRNEIFTYIKELLVANLTPEEISSIVRIGIFPKDDYNTKLFTKFNSGQILNSMPVNGYTIHIGYIFASNPETS